MGKAIDVLKCFCTAFYKARDIEAALSVMSEDVFWFGINEEMDAHNRTEARRYLEREMLRDTKRYELEFFDALDGNTQSDPSRAALRLKITSGSLKLMIRASACLRDGKINALHMSLAADEMKRTAIRSDSGLYSEKTEAEIKETLLKELERANRNFRDLLENVSCGICIYNFDENGNVTLEYMNDGFCRLCESDQESLLAAFTNDSLFGVCEEDRERVRNFFRSSVASPGKLNEISYHGILLSGKQRWCTLRITAIKRPGGGHTVYATYYDITEQMIAENQLRDVIHNVPGAVCYYRWNGTKLEPIVISEQYSEILGTDAMDSLNRTEGIQFSHVHPDDLAGVQAAFLEGISHSHRMNHTYRSFNDKKKKYIWINVQGRVFPQEDGTALAYVTYMDISKDKEIEQHLLESKQSLEAATEQAGVWYWLYDSARDIGYISDRAARDFDLPSMMDDFTENWLKTELIDSEYHDAYRNMVKKIKDGASEASADCKGRTPDGTPHWGRFQLKNLYDSKGNVTGAIGTVKFIDDIMELQKKYELERRRGQVDDGSLIARALFNLSSGTTLEMERHSPLLPISSIMSLEEFSTDIATNIANDAQREAFSEIFNREHLLACYNSGETELGVNFRRTLPGGKSIWVNAAFHMMPEPDGRDILLFYYCDDINKEKTTEIMMSFMANNDYDMLGCMNFHDSSAIMLYGKNSSLGGSDNKLTEENYNESMILFANSVIIPEERDNYIASASSENVQRLLETEDSLELIVHILGKNGERLTKKIHYVSYKAEKDICIFTQTDITELVEEEQRKQDELKKALAEAEQASRSKTMFLSQMSHEIRTPMNAIIGMAKLAEGNAENPGTKNYLEKIDHSSHYLLDIINDILDMSRIESGRFELHPEWSAANEMLMTCIDMLSSEMEQKGINFSKPGRDKDSGLEFFVDPLRVKQILMNLLNNAVKFTPPGGNISLSIETKEIDEDHREDTVTISDTGCGMSEEFLGRIFKPFEQEQNIYSASVQGTGLGLALVKQILNAMGGEISVSSKLGEGSVFVYRMPYKYRRSDKAPIVLPEVSDAKLSGKRILLVDDHPLNREIAKKLLERKMVLVEESENGLEAINKFSASPLGHFDAILMDIRMPVMDGLKATEAIRKLERADASGIPIIAMTANAFDDDVRTSKSAGMNGHLAKPVEPGLLYGQLAKYIAEHEETDKIH